MGLATCNGLGKPGNSGNPSCRVMVSATPRPYLFYQGHKRVCCPSCVQSRGLTTWSSLAYDSSWGYVVEKPLYFLCALQVSQRLPSHDWVLELFPPQEGCPHSLLGVLAVLAPALWTGDLFTGDPFNAIMVAHSPSPISRQSLGTVSLKWGEILPNYIATCFSKPVI